MPKVIILFLFLLLLVSSCYIGTLEVYDYRPIIEMEREDTTAILFRVPDLDPDGWWNGDGEDSKSIEITIKETAGTEAYIENIEWEIIGENNQLTSDGENMLIKSVELNDNDTLYTVNITLTEHDANELDEADGIQDNVGEGVLKIQMIYYDKFGNIYESKPLYAPIKIIKP